MATRSKGLRGRAEGATQLELFPRDVLAACARGQREPLRTSHGQAVALTLADGGNEEGGADLFQLVAVWHDRNWDPDRVFKRADGASVIVFQVHGGGSPRESRLAKS
jgi:hypothetical protein